MRSCETCRHTLGEEHCRGCNYSMGLQWWEPKPITNADRIRSMTVEELAEFLSRNDPECDPPEWWLRWLKEEAKSDD